MGHADWQRARGFHTNKQCVACEFLCMCCDWVCACSGAYRCWEDHATSRILYKKSPVDDIPPRATRTELFMLPLFVMQWMRLIAGVCDVRWVAENKINDDTKKNYLSRHNDQVRKNAPSQSTSEHDIDDLQLTNGVVCGTTNWKHGWVFFLRDVQDRKKICFSILNSTIKTVLMPWTILLSKNNMKVLNYLKCEWS